MLIGVPVIIVITSDEYFKDIFKLVKLITSIVFNASFLTQDTNLSIFTIWIDLSHILLRYLGLLYLYNLHK